MVCPIGAEYWSFKPLSDIEVEKIQFSIVKGGTLEITSNIKHKFKKWKGGGGVFHMKFYLV